MPPKHRKNWFQVIFTTALLPAAGTAFLAFAAWCIEVDRNQTAMASGLETVKSVEVERDKRNDQAIEDLHDDIRDIKQTVHEISHRLNERNR